MELGNLLGQRRVIAQDVVGNLISLFCELYGLDVVLQLFFNLGRAEEHLSKVDPVGPTPLRGRPQPPSQERSALGQQAQPLGQELPGLGRALLGQLELAQLECKLGRRPEQVLELGDLVEELWVEFLGESAVPDGLLEALETLLMLLPLPEVPSLETVDLTAEDMVVRVPPPGEVLIPNLHNWRGVLLGLDQ